MTTSIVSLTSLRSARVRRTAFSWAAMLYASSLPKTSGGFSSALGSSVGPREDEPGEDERDHDGVRKALPLPRRAKDSHHRATACARKRLVFVRLPQTDIAHQREDELRERS